MPRPGEDPSLDDDGLAVRVDDQLREVMAYNNGFLLESSGDEEWKDPVALFDKLRARFAPQP